MRRICISNSDIAAVINLQAFIGAVGIRIKGISYILRTRFSKETDAFGIFHFNSTSAGRRGNIIDPGIDCCVNVHIICQNGCQPTAGLPRITKKSKLEICKVIRIGNFQQLPWWCRAKTDIFGAPDWACGIGRSRVIPMILRPRNGDQCEVSYYKKTKDR